MAVVLRGLLNKNDYFRYGAALSQQKSLEKEHKLILGAIHEYWKRYPEAERMTPDELIVFFYRQNPALKDKQDCDDALALIKHVDVANEKLLRDELESVLEVQYITRVYHMCVSLLEEREPTVIYKVKDECLQFEEVTGRLDEIDENIVGDLTLEELLAQQKGEYRWRLPWLNEHLSFPPAGTLGHIFALPDVGKTSMAVSEAVWIAHQMRNTNDKVLYLGNEEKMSRTYLRAFCSLAGADSRWLEDPANQEEAGALYRRFVEETKPHLICVDSVYDIRSVEMHIRRHEPKVVWIDQGPKVHMPGKAEGPERLKLLYNWYRETMKKYDVVGITLGQADAKSENKPYLSLQNMDGSKVGIPGELDWSFGISKKDADGMEWRRYITICKNKLTGDMAHTTCYLDRLKVRYK